MIFFKSLFPTLVLRYCKTVLNDDVTYQIMFFCDVISYDSLTIS